MTAPPVQRTYALGQPEARSVLGRREPREVALIVVAVAAGLCASVLSGGHPAAFLLLAIMVAGALAAVTAPYRGRTLFRWLPADVRFLGATVSGRRRYASEARLAGVAVGGTAVVTEPPAVGRLTWHRFSLRQRGAVALVHPDGGLTVCLEVEGQGVGLADAADRELAATRWTTLLRDLANSEGLVDRLSLLERSVPADPQAHERYVQEHGWVPAPAVLAASYEDLQGLVDAESAQHRNFVVVRIQGGRPLARAIRSAGGGPAALSVVIERECAAMTQRLHDAGLRVLRALDEPGLAALISSCFGPFRAIDDSHGMRADLSWPYEAWSDVGSYITDGWHHATAWVRSWPSLPVTVDFLSPLLIQAPGVVRTVAATFQVERGDRALGKAMRDLTHDEAQLAASARAGRTHDPRDGRQRSQVELRAQDLAAGHAGLRLNGWVTVSAGSAEDLDEAKRAIASAATRSHLVLEWCDKEHETAFTHTLPLGRGIR